MNRPDTCSSPKASIVIPSLDGIRQGAVARLLQSIEEQSLSDHEIQLVKGVVPQGRAINAGVQLASASIVVIVDDDSRLANADTLKRLVESLNADPSIGMAGASILVSPEANAFQRRAARQFPRLQTPEVEQITDSDMACHGCCAIRRSVFHEVGGEREDIVRGLDPDLRVRLRAAGYRVVLVPGAAVYHPMPNGWRALFRTFFRNGYGSAYATRFSPSSVFETHESLSSEEFIARRSLTFRVLRFPIRLGHALAHGQFIRFGAYTAYAAGFLWGLVTATELRPAGPAASEGA